MLDITYDPEADAAQITLGGAKIAESQEVAPGFIFDYDRDGRVVGIEVLHASKLLAPEAWAHARLPGEHFPAALSFSLDPRERARLIAEAQEASRRLRNDQADRAHLGDVIDMQAENADALKP